MEGRLFTGRRKRRPPLRGMDDVVAGIKAITVDGEGERQRAVKTGC